MSTRRLVYYLAAWLFFLTGGAIEAQVIITSGPPPAGVVGTPYNFTFTATGGGDCSATTSYSWSATVLPDDGISIDTAGNLSGTPANPGNITFTVTASNNSCTGQTANQQYTIPISNPGQPPPPVQPANTIAYISQLTDLPLKQVLSGVDGTFGSDPCDSCTEGFTDIASDAIRGGNFIVAANGQLAIYAAGGGTPSTFTASQLMALNPALFSNMPSLVSAAVDKNGNYIVADSGNNQIVGIIANASGIPTGATQIASYNSYFAAPNAGDAFVRLDSAGNYILVIDNNNEEASAAVYVIRVAAGSASVNCAPVSGSPSCTNISTAPTGAFLAPASVGGLTLDGSGNYVITDFDNDYIYSISPTGAGATLIYDGTSTLSDPEGITYDPLSRDFFLVDDQNGALYTIGPSMCTIASCTLTTVDSNLVSPEAVVVLDTTATFDLSSVTSQSTPASQTVAGLTATFSSPADPGGFSVSSGSEGLTVGTVLIDPGPANMSDIPLTITFSQAIASVALPFVTDGAGTFSLSAFSGTASVGAASVTGTVPSGDTFPQGVISFSTTAPGGFNSITLTSPSTPYFAIANVAVTFTPMAPPPPPPPLVISGNLPQAFADEPYSAGAGASGGVPPYTYGASGFPSGIGINQYTGTIGGQTAQTGTFTVSLSVTDSLGASAGITATLTVVPPPPISLSSASLGSDVVGTPISTVVSASGGAPPYNYAVTGGGLPPGLNLQSGGTLRGTPLTAGSYSFTVKATDSTGGTASGSFSITITPPPLTINAPSPFATGAVSLGYPTQTISVKGGTAPYTFAVTTGSLPAGLTLSATGMISGTPTAATPSGGVTFTVTAMDSSATPSTGAVNLSITVQPFTKNIVLSSGSLAFALDTGATTVPPAQTVGVQSTMTTQPINYSVAVQPSSAAWLSATSGSVTPGTLSVSLTQAALSLAASTTPYTANVVVTCMSTGCAGNSQTLPVTLTVSSPPPVLSVQATTLSFNTTSANPQTTTQSLVVSNTGGGGIGFASIGCGAPWCTVSGTPASIGAQATANLMVTANPAGLAAGYYFTSVSIVSSAGSASVPVTLSIEPNGVISLSPAGAEFTLPQGGLLTPGSLTVGITGTTPVSYTASVSSGTFLQIMNGTGTASGTSPGEVTYSFDNSQISKLAPGTYYGTISVAAGGASNSPQSYEVVVNVTPATTPSVPNPTPGGLIFLTQATATPPAQTISVVSFSAATAGFQAAASTMSGGNWLSVSPATGTTAGGAPGTVNVTANPSGLNPGVYNGAVNFSFAGTTAVRTVNVTLVVENTGSATTSAISRKDATTGCTPSQLVPTSTALVGNFAAPAAWPVPLAIALVDDCGNLINNGQIVATFSNGDPPLILALADPTMASYVATWTPEHAAGQITINVRATAPTFKLATAQLGGAVTPNNAPILADLAIANFYNPIGGAPLAPGSLVQITGQYLSGLTMNAPSIPLPLTLGGTSVTIGGMQAPISMVSPGQVNAQVPFELPAGQPYQVIISANSALTTPQSFQAGAASPGLSVLPSGYVNASHPSGAPVTEAAPAKPGENISVYLVGMGATTIPVASGQPGPSGTFATTVINPGLTLNNENTTVSFSGLIPGLVGVYQVNFTVPSDAPNGDLTLSLVENAFTSNSGLLPVHM